MIRIISIILMCCILSLTLTSCVGANEIDDWIYSFTIGIDKGVTDIYRFTYQLSSMKPKGQEDISLEQSKDSRTSKKFNNTVITVDSSTLFSGINMINTTISKTINLTHVNYIIFSEDLAREGIEPFINGIERCRQIRRTLYILVANGKASDFLNEFNPIIGISIGKTHELFMEAAGKTGLFPKSEFDQFNTNIKSPYGQAIAPIIALDDYSSFKMNGNQPKKYKSFGDYYAGQLPKKGGNEWNIMGTAIFDGDKMVDKLNGDESLAMLMIRGEFRMACMPFEDPLKPDLRLTILTQQRKKPIIKVNIKDSKPVISVEIFLAGELENVQSSVGYENGDKKKLLEDYVANIIKDRLDKTVDKCKSLNCEVFRFGEIVKMKFLTIQELEDYNWISRFKDAKVTTKVEFIIKRTGTMSSTAKVHSTRGEEK